MLTVAAVDPRAVTRDALCKMLFLADRKINFLPFSSANDALTTANTCFDIFMLHVGSCTFSFDWVQRELLAIRSIDRPIAVLCDHCDFTDVTEATSLGATGYILTTFPAKVVTCAIRIVAAGGEFIPAEALRQETSCQASCEPSANIDLKVRVENPAGSITFLSPKQRLVLHHLYYGKSNKQIAEAVGISVCTVKVHVRHIMRKLKVHNRTHACAAALHIVHHQ